VATVGTRRRRSARSDGDMPRHALRPFGRWARGQVGHGPANPFQLFDDFQIIQTDSNVKIMKRGTFVVPKIPKFCK
jgi:hypothetical protein